MFQIKRILGFCCRLLQNCRDDSLNVTVPMRMLDIFSSEKTYLPVIPDASYVASLLEQILHYMVQTGYYKSLFILVNHRLPSSLEYSDAPSIPMATTLLEHILKPLHFNYSSCTAGARYSATFDLLPYIHNTSNRLDLFIQLGAARLRKKD
ncbi:ubiquitin-protein ligase E3C-like [Notothenia coriiceps]|uniref:Ubiquitin-protein ligase E3C-like n=1 Tax=Notothenia coriiceps TaxID=8208 RepID=A0A6I9NLQ1_9TELE|nr:PREDICTED: ubiquitin-protein ligase E3C-like [Notothenia coriiceps]